MGRQAQPAGTLGHLLRGALAGLSLAGLVGLAGCTCVQDPPNKTTATQPATASDVDPRLMTLLNTYEAPALSAFASLGLSAAADLRLVAEDPGGALVIRGRAVTALQAFPEDPLSGPWLRTLVGAPHAPELLKRKAKDVLSRWGTKASTLTKTSRY